MLLYKQFQGEIMKKSKKKLVIIDYITIIATFVTFLISLIMYYTFSYRSEVNVFLGMMVITGILILIGFKNLRIDTN